MGLFRQNNLEAKNPQRIVRDKTDLLHCLLHRALPHIAFKT
jgi:hypothetical protein